MAVALEPSLREQPGSAATGSAAADAGVEEADAPFWWRFLHTPSAMIGGVIVFLVVAIALVSFLWTPYNPNAIDLSHTFAGPSLAHPLGTDDYGRDVLSRLMSGSRLTLYAGVLSVLIAAAIGIPAGLVAASYGRFASEAIMRTADLVYAFPALVAAIALTAALGPSTTTSMIAIGIAFTPFVARVVRSGAVSVLTSEYVLAARAYGRSRGAILRRHVVPNIMPLIVVQLTLLFSIAILAEAALAYLGLGAPPPAASWGLMLYDAQSDLYNDGLLSLWPALAIAIAVLGFNLLGDGLRDVLDPKLRVAPLILLEIDRLSVRLGTVPVLDEITLSLAAGERLGLIGESGAGKSVTALAVLGLLPEGMTASGSVRIDGEDLYAVSERRRCELRGTQVAMVFQEPMTALNPLMRVGKQIAEAARVHRKLSRAGAAREAIELLERVGLADPAAQSRAFPHELSGGQRQRVMMAIAIACRPALILADEPTTALDVTVQAQVLGVLRRLVEESGSALLFISHDLAVVSSMCERLAVMYGGRVVEEGTTAALLESPRHPYTAGLLATSRAVSADVEEPADELPAISGTVPPLGRFGSGCVFRSRCERATEACSVQPPLEGLGHRFACWHPVEAPSERQPVSAVPFQPAGQ